MVLRTGHADTPLVDACTLPRLRDASALAQQRMRYLHAGENSSNLSVNLSVLLPDQKAAPFMSSGRLGVHQSGLVWNQAPVGLDGNTMNQVDYLQHGTESLPFQNKLEIKCFSDYQIKDVDINQTSGKNNLTLDSRV